MKLLSIFHLPLPVGWKWWTQLNPAKALWWRRFENERFTFGDWVELAWVMLFLFPDAFVWAIFNPIPFIDELSVQILASFMLYFKMMPLSLDTIDPDDRKKFPRPRRGKGWVNRFINHALSSPFVWESGGDKAIHARRRLIKKLNDAVREKNKKKKK